MVQLCNILILFIWIGTVHVALTFEGKLIARIRYQQRRFSESTTTGNRIYANIVDRNQNTNASPTRFFSLMESADDANVSENSDSESTQSDDVSEPPRTELLSLSSLLSSSSSSSSSSLESSEVRQPPPRRLDPLVVSLTKMDEDARNAPTLQVPIWGELILDRSLFLLIPAILFTILGIGTSILILINSGDEFVDALAETAKIQSIPTSFSPPLSVPSDAVDTGGCRGLCSTQEADLNELRKYMERMAGK